jgi:hypothetical protein
MVNLPPPDSGEIAGTASLFGAMAVMRSPRTVLSWFAAHALAPLVLVGALGFSGCSASAPKGGDAVVAAQRTVVSFLEAIRRGDDTAARQLLSTVARTKTDELGISVAPPVEDTANYAVAESEVVNEDGDIVHVATTWTDTDSDGFKTSENVVWVVRLDPEGWRVVGMAMRIFDDLPPLLLNFEDPEDMLAKQELVAEELQKRATAAQQNAGQERTAGKPGVPGSPGPK